MIVALPAPSPLLLVLLLPLLTAVMQLATPVASQPDVRAYSGSHFDVCTSARAPYILQDAATGAVTGYEVDLLNAVQGVMGFTYTMKVLSWDAMMSGLLLSPGQPGYCDFAPSSVPMTTTSMNKGITFSYPTFRSGFLVAVPVADDTVSIWSFGRVFNWDMWVALMITGLGLGLVVLAMERDYSRRGMGKIKLPPGLQAGIYEAVYVMYCRLFNINSNSNVLSIASKIVNVAWGLTVLVCVSSYTAQLTATLTSANFQSTIGGVFDLAHARVETSTAAIYNFKKFGFIATGFDWSTDADVGAMVDRLVHTDAFDALVLDAPTLRYMVAARCDVNIVGDVFDYQNNGVAFNAGANYTLVDSYNYALNNLLVDGTMEKLEGMWIKTSVDCPAAFQPNAPITFLSMQGLWIINGAVVAFATLLALLPHLSKRFDLDVQLTPSASGTGLVGRMGSTLGKSFARAMSLRKNSVGADAKVVLPSADFNAFRSELSSFQTEASTMDMSTKGKAETPPPPPPTSATAVPTTTVQPFDDGDNGHSDTLLLAAADGRMMISPASPAVRAAADSGAFAKSDSASSTNIMAARLNSSR